MLPLREDRRQQEALKVALASTLSGFIILWMHADNPFWAPALVIVFMSEYLEGSITSAIERLISSFLGGISAIWIAHDTLHNEFFYILVLCLIVAVCIYSFLVYGSGWLNFAVTFSFIYLYLLYYPHGGFDLAYWRVFQVTLAAVCWVLISAILFPNRAQEGAKNQFALCMQKIAGHLSQLDTTTSESIKMTMNHAFIPLTKAVAAIPKSGDNAAKSIAAKNAITSLQSILRAMAKLLGVSDLHLTDYSNCFTRISNSMQKLATSSFSRDDFREFHETLNETLIQITDYNTTHNRLITNELFGHLFDSLFTLNDNLFAWRTGSCVTQHERKLHVWSRIWHDLRARPERVRHSLCAGLGCSLVVVIWFITNWEGGICAVISALVVGADFSLQKINMKIALRFRGSLAGSLVAMFLVIFVIKTTAMLFVCLFVGVLLFGYLATGNFKQMYFSWMATMSYVITLIPSNSMENNFDFMIERAIGLLFGLAIMWFVMNFFFQVNPDQVMKRHQNRIRGKLAEFFQLMAQLAQGNKQLAMQKLTDAVTYLREQTRIGDTLANETNHIEDWGPIREISLTVFWCYRYLLKTTVLNNEKLTAAQATLFIANCQTAANHLHPHLGQSAWTAAVMTEIPNDPAATLFLREFNDALTQIQALVLPEHLSYNSSRYCPGGTAG